ncbi:L-rhamnose mutarotase [Streptomyces sp. NBC_00988]|uniref:L-rhamnose mutarotase n=1 Tax=Streptomyces sp. NBC_00988 TaxID=2903704 RepID=UPI00386F169D|nr:L-rhamnose mutarotase [Streptomyces sp. NBC_00988]
MQFVALHTRLRPGMEEAYEETHREVPAALVHDLKARGVVEWRIWRHGRDLFHLVECEDYAAFAAGPATNETAETWGDRMDPYLEVQNDLSDPDRNMMRAVWTMTGNPQ